MVRPKLVHIVTSPLTAQSFLRGQLSFLRERGFDVTLISAPGPELDWMRDREGVATIALPMRREPAPFHDAVSLTRLSALLRSLRPEIVHCGTPKASFLAGMAGWLARVPVRVMTLHGMRADGLRPPSQNIMLAMERLSCRLAHRVYCVGESLRERALQLNLAFSGKLRILARGTANGIDAEYFSRTPQVLADAELLRQRLHLDSDGPVIGFVGRLVRDKGIEELITAFKLLKSEFPRLKLLLIGRFEAYNDLTTELRAEITDDPQIIHAGFLEDPRPAYALMNVLALPSHREGFPYVPMEAAALEVPAVVTRVTGCIDAVLDGMTGAVVPPHDAGALAAALRGYLESPELGRTHGAAGRARVLSDFQPTAVWEALAREYIELLQTAQQFRSADALSPRPRTEALGITLEEGRVQC